MLKKTIQYEDFDGKKIEDVFYFNLTKAELIELEVATQGGLEEYLKNIANSNDGQKIIDEFKRIILLAYGKKSEDGKRFIKSDELRQEFQQTNAYSELFMELATNAEAAAMFIRGVLPSDLVPVDNQRPIPGIMEHIEKTRDLNELSKEELLEELKKRNQA